MENEVSMWDREAILGCLKDEYFKPALLDMEGHAPRDVLKHYTCIIVVWYVLCLN